MKRAIADFLHADRIPATLSVMLIAVSILVMTARLQLAFSSARAREELRWQHRDAPTMWRDTIAGELALLQRYRRRTLAEKLRPVDPDALASLAETR